MVVIVDAIDVEGVVFRALARNSRTSTLSHAAL
jgi:hypothetical protein